MSGKLNSVELAFAVAASTAGVVRRQDLIAAGLAASCVDDLLRSGRVQRYSRGVYVVPALESSLTRVWAPLLATSGSAVANVSAARAHDFNVPEPRRLHLLTGKGAGRRLAGVMVHESRRFRSIDVMVGANGIPVTTPERTLFDLGAQFSTRRLTHLMQTQVAANWPKRDSLLACYRALARPGVPGLERITMALSELFADEPCEGSVLEQRVWAALTEFGIGGFRQEYRPPWFDGIRGTVDFAHPGAKVIVEADGRRWHATYEAMANDRQRDRRAVAAGWVVLRVSWNEVVHRPAATFQEVREVVDARCPDAITV